MRFSLIIIGIGVLFRFFLGSHVHVISNFGSATFTFNAEISGEHSCDVNQWWGTQLHFVISPMVEDLPLNKMVACPTRLTTFLGGTSLIRLVA